MTPLDHPLAYVAREWPVFPCNERKTPFTERGFHDATLDEGQITEWWTRWPDALIGMPTGRPSGRVVLDVDVKHAAANGFDTLADLGYAILPDTPMVHTRSGGLHLYFDSTGSPEIHNTGGARGRGIGSGLDRRGQGGYVILPSPKSGYWWHLYCGIDTPLAPVPAMLLPRELEPPRAAQPIERTAGLSPYAEGALDRACRAIVAAPDGEQECTLVGECFSIGRLAGAGRIPAELARRVLQAAARDIRDYNPHRP